MDDFPTDRSPRSTTLILLFGSLFSPYQSIQKYKYIMEYNRMHFQYLLLYFQLILMQKIRKNDYEKQNMLGQNIITNSRNGSKRKLHRLSLQKLGSVQAKTKLKNRYQSSQNHVLTNTLELPTFGDWKAHFNKFDNSNRNSSQKTNNVENPQNTISTQQQEKSNQRIKMYRQSKLKQIVDSNKLKQKPQLNPIDNIITKKFTSGSNGQPKKKTLTSRARALSRQFQSHFQTIDSNLHRIVNRKQIFKTLYLKQKQRYEQILHKYGIQQNVDDTEFKNYFKVE